MPTMPAAEQTPRVVEPVIIPLDERHAELVNTITGFSASTLIALNESEAPGIVRQRGQGNGTRTYLHLESFRRWAASLPIHRASKGSGA
jgi:hypothetical protein